MKIQKTILVLTLTLISFWAEAHRTSPVPEAEPVKRILEEYRSKEWYDEQARAWKEVLNKNEKNIDAWYNFYAANRLGGNREILPQILKDVRKRIAHTQVHYLLELWQQPGEAKTEEFIRKAERYDPNHPQLLDHKFVYHYKRGEAYKLQDIGERWFKTGSLDPELLAFAYNMLMSVEDDAVLLTFGDADTLPLWVLQQGAGIRKDVRILPPHLLKDEKNRDNILKMLRLGKAESFDAPAVNQTAHIINQIMNANPGDKFYTAVTMPPAVSKGLQQPLWLTGLASYCGEEKEAYKHILKKNWEEKFLTDHLRVPLSPKPAYATSVIMSANYIIPLRLLEKHYQSIGEEEKAEDIHTLSGKIADRSGKKEAFASLSGKKAEPAARVTKPLSNYFDDNPKALKTLEKRLKKVGDKLFAFETEVTNSDYHAFLRYLKANGLTDKYEQARPKYDESNPLYQAYHFDFKGKNLPKSQIDYGKYPVVNITRTGVRLFLEWLNEQYKNTSEKKTFENIVFRLPDSGEWQLSALTSSQLEKGIKYPWGGPLAMNGLGCYLGNFKVEDCDCPAQPAFGDGFNFTAPVATYFPNDNGLYDLSGNVWEMTHEAGLNHGGGWNTKPESATVYTAKQVYEASPEVGFRVFADISGEWGDKPLLSGGHEAPAEEFAKLNEKWGNTDKWESERFQAFLEERSRAIQERENEIESWAKKIQDSADKEEIRKWVEEIRAASRESREFDKSLSEHFKNERFPDSLSNGKGTDFWERFGKRSQSIFDSLGSAQADFWKNFGDSISNLNFNFNSDDFDFSESFDFDFDLEDYFSVEDLDLPKVKSRSSLSSNNTSFSVITISQTGDSDSVTTIVFAVGKKASDKELEDFKKAAAIEGLIFTFDDIQRKKGKITHMTGTAALKGAAEADKDFITPKLDLYNVKLSDGKRVMFRTDRFKGFGGAVSDEEIEFKFGK